MADPDSQYEYVNEPISAGGSIGEDSSMIMSVRVFIARCASDLWRMRGMSYFSILVECVTGVGGQG